MFLPEHQLFFSNFRVFVVQYLWNFILNRLHLYIESTRKPLKLTTLRALNGIMRFIKQKKKVHGKKKRTQKKTPWIWVVPLPRVTTRIITFLVGDSYKPSSATIAGKGDNPTLDAFDSWNNKNLGKDEMKTHPPICRSVKPNHLDQTFTVCCLPLAGPSIQAHFEW